MAVFSVARKWFAAPSRIALLFGIGALSAAGPSPAAKAEPTPQQRDASAQLRIWNDAGRIYVTERGGGARELRLGDTAEARHLAGLLQRAGATAAKAAVRLDPMLLAGGGGEGLHWAPPARAANPDAAPTASATAPLPVEAPPGARPPAPRHQPHAATLRSADKD